MPGIAATRFDFRTPAYYCPYIMNPPMSETPDDAVLRTYMYTLAISF